MVIEQNDIKFEVKETQRGGETKQKAGIVIKQVREVSDAV